MLPSGFKANGINAKIKASNKLDLALVFSEKPAKAAALFTSNQIKAAHIKVCQEHFRKSRTFSALVVNSGNANSFTGERGVGDAEAVTSFLAKELHLNQQDVLIASTGVIGKRLAVEKIKAALPLLIKGLSKSGLITAARAMMTTDTFPKIASKKIQIAGKEVVLCGIAKGAGMIAPNLATMLCFILTDAKISQQALREALASAIEKSFNCITVDGCMSTNDTCLILANAAAANPLIETGSRYFVQFTQALAGICLELAKMIVKDAEGATKFIMIKVRHARNFKEAKNAAMAVANSNLFKTAVYGENPNLGRIVAAVGAQGIKVKEKNFKIKMGALKNKLINLTLDLKRGKAEAVVYTSDLTPQYVKINASYN